MNYLKLTAYINEKKEVVGFVELANINSWIFNKIRMMENTNLLNPPQRTSMIYHDLKFQQIVKKRDVLKKRLDTGQLE